MNFLSHYYFERNNPNHYVVMGVILPDLIKNADKFWNIHPQKTPALYQSEESLQSILRGWQKHLEVDNYFHTSEFFKTETANLKKLILPCVTAGPVKPFFLAHIGLELMLDHLLLHSGMINIETFYQQLHQANNNSLSDFLAKADIPDQHIFDTFLDDFLQSRYLFSYQKLHNISYALNRICMRVWNNPFTDAQLDLLTHKLDEYCPELESRFMTIFEELEENPAIRAI
jgi:hypothetical protein